MRKIKILSINATSGGLPGSIEVATDFTPIFQGKFYRNPTTGEVLPAYTTPAPATHNLIRATTFDIVENTKYAGRYTVYTSVSASDTKPSVFTAGTNRTLVNVNETIPGLLAGEAASLTSAGYVTNISTYLIYTGTANIVIPPTVNITTYPVEFMGRDSSGWGEAFTQNFVNLTRNFASPTAPANPFVGQTWYDTDDQQIRVWNGTIWDLLNKSSFGVTYRHTQGTAATTWTINHNLGLAAPYIAFCQFYVERGNGPQIIIPSDVQFVNGNRLTVTFSNAEIGYVLVRQ